MKANISIATTTSASGERRKSLRLTMKIVKAGSSALCDLKVVAKLGIKNIVMPKNARIATTKTVTEYKRDPLTWL